MKTKQNQQQKQLFNVEITQGSFGGTRLSSQMSQVDLCEFHTSLLYIEVSDQLGLQRETLCQERKKQTSKCLADLSLPQASHFHLALHPQEASV